MLEPSVQYILFRINSQSPHHGKGGTSSLFVGIAHSKIVK